MTDRCASGCDCLRLFGVAFRQLGEGQGEMTEEEFHEDTENWAATLFVVFGCMARRHPNAAYRRWAKSCLDLFPDHQRRDAELKKKERKEWRRRRRH